MREIGFWQWFLDGILKYTPKCTPNFICSKAEEPFLIDFRLRIRLA